MARLVRRAIDNRANAQDIIGKLVMATDSNHGFEKWVVDHPYAHTYGFVTEYEKTFHNGPREIPYPIDYSSTEDFSTWWPGAYMLTWGDQHPVMDMLVNLYYKIIDDHEVLRWVMIDGSLTKKNLEESTFPRSSRDPCCGFLNMRKEIVVEITNAMDAWAKRYGHKKKLRWGACDFGSKTSKSTSGDMMHFDVFDNTIDIVELEKSTVVTTTHSNDASATTPKSTNSSQENTEG